MRHHPGKNLGNELIGIIYSAAADPLREVAPFRDGKSDFSERFILLTCGFFVRRVTQFMKDWVQDMA
jgi:hypothetical protein